jgi:WD40 repeat protein
MSASFLGGDTTSVGVSLSIFLTFRYRRRRARSPKKTSLTKHVNFYKTLFVFSDASKMNMQFRIFSRAKMVLQHMKSWRHCCLEPFNPLDKITALAWSPDAKKVAVATGSRMIWLYDTSDGKRKDKFLTKCARKNEEKKEEKMADGTPCKGVRAACMKEMENTLSYAVKGLAFSPDSTKLAVAQTDGSICIYKIGHDWGSKKSICYKFLHAIPTTCLLWPTKLAAEDPFLVYGLADGTVVKGDLKRHRSTALASSLGASFVVAISLHPDGVSAFISAHYDGRLYRHSLRSTSSPSSSSVLTQHTCAAFALAWTPASVVAAGSDGRVALYNPESGHVFHVYDHSTSTTPCREFICAALTGRMLVLANFNALYIYSCGQATCNADGAGESVPVKQLGIHHVPNMYSATALAWSPDGTRLVVGSFCGALDVYDSKASSSALEQPQEPSPAISNRKNSSSLSVETLYAEAKTLGIEKGLQLLASHNQIQSAIDHATACHDFAYALKVCDLGFPSRTAAVHHQHARHQQKHGLYREAEESYLLAKAPADAIKMYVSESVQDFVRARRLADEYEPSFLPTVLEAQANALIGQPARPHNGFKYSNHKTAIKIFKLKEAESLYLKAGLPEKALKMYMKQELWPDAFRVAHSYLPFKLSHIVSVAEGNKTLQSPSDSSYRSDPPSSVQAGNDDILTLTGPADIAPLRQALEYLGQRQEWTHVYSMLAHQAEKDNCGTGDKKNGLLQLLWDDMIAFQVQQILGIEKFISLHVVEEAVGALTASGGPSPLTHLDLYRKLLRALFYHQSLEEELQQGKILGKLLRDLRQILLKALRQHRAIEEKTEKVTGNQVDAAGRRDKDIQEKNDVEKLEDFEKMFSCVHYSHILTALLTLLGGITGTRTVGEGRRELSNPPHVPLLTLACKVAVTLLRYAPAIIPLDKAYYVAGTLIRRRAQNGESEELNLSYHHLAFLLLNRYVDLAEAIEDKLQGAMEKRRDGAAEEEGEGAPIELTGLAEFTALPRVTHPLPGQHYLKETARDEARNWILSVCAIHARADFESPPFEDAKSTARATPILSPAQAPGTLYEGLYSPAPGPQARRLGVKWCALTGYPLDTLPSKEGRVGVFEAEWGTKNEECLAARQDMDVWVESFHLCPVTGRKRPSDTITEMAEKAKVTTFS